MRAQRCVFCHNFIFQQWLSVLSYVLYIQFHLYCTLVSCKIRDTYINNINKRHLLLWVQEQRLKYWLQMMMMMMMWKIKMIKLQFWVSLGRDFQTPDPLYNLQPAQHLCFYYCNNKH